MTKARDLANAGTALTSVSATELGYLDGVTSAVQTQIDSKEPTLPSQTGNSGKYLTTNGSTKSWGTVSQYALPSQTGNSGKFLTTNGTSESWGTVNQPITWTNRLNVNGLELFKVVYNGSDLYVAVGSNGGNSALYTSSDGTTWTSRTSGFAAGHYPKSVAFGNGLWVAVGTNGTIITSTDGITWTARTSNMSTNDINDVIYANSLWVAVGAGGGTTNTGGITYSSDGTTWTRKSQSISVGITYRAVAWNGTNWIVGANHSTNNYLYASTPSGTWTAAATPGTGTLYKIIWDGTRHQINDNGANYYSTSTTMSSATFQHAHLHTTNGYSGAIHLYDGKLYTINDQKWASFTVASSGSPTLQNWNWNPGRINNAGSGLITSSYGIWVGAAGIIITGEGGIWTSF